MAAKGTRVTEREKEKMWQLYQEGYTFVKIAKQLRRGESTVSRYVHEYEAAIRGAGCVLNRR
ncbi:MAG: helix-turn-helix domain-containing protein [Ruminococcaceae bacterium]|nr:helix-turn-helix domain-containing protein [Oscillospiraceae bacterium]